MIAGSKDKQNEEIYEEDLGDMMDLKITFEGPFRRHTSFYCRMHIVFLPPRELWVEPGSKSRDGMWVGNG